MDTANIYIKYTHINYNEKWNTPKKTFQKTYLKTSFESEKRLVPEGRKKSGSILSLMGGESIKEQK